MDYQQGLEKVNELIKDIHVCMLTTISAEGQPVSRPMGVQQVESDGDLWFFAYEDSDKAVEIRTNPEVNVAFSDTSKNTWVSLSGTAELIHDHSKATELWNPLLQAWFPEGLDTEALVLIKVRAETAEYWDAPNGKALMLFGAIKAAVTGTPPEAGENKTVEL
jgi:general stress protein 26